jgi:hypothetical protein
MRQILRKRVTPLPVNNHTFNNIGAQSSLLIPDYKEGNLLSLSKENGLANDVLKMLKISLNFFS